MNCSRMQDLLSSFIDDELGPRDTNALLAHLRACPSCREQLEELRTLQQLHRRALAHKAAPVSSLAFTKKVMMAVQRQDAKMPLDASEWTPSWHWKELWNAFIHGRRWVAPAMAVGAVALIMLLNPFSSPDQDLRPVGELQTTQAEVAAQPGEMDDMIEHYLTEHTISVVEAPHTSSADSLQFVSYSQ